MSKIALQGNVSGTGTISLVAPNTSTDRTLTLPDEAGTVLTSASTVAASQITSALNATGSAPIYAARAWVNFNGTGTVAIRAAGNVSSITDNGTGRYVLNFTNAVTDANYASVIGFGDATTSSQTQIDTVTRTTTACGINGLNAAGTAFFDISFVTVAVFR